MCSIKQQNVLISSRGTGMKNIDNFSVQFFEQKSYTK